MTAVSSPVRATKSKCIVHVVPYDGVGGVETALRSMDAGLADGIAFHKYFIANPDAAIDDGYVQHGAYPSPSDPRNFFLAIVRILRLDPDLLIASLWRGALALLAVKLLRPHSRTVVFLHSSKAVHWLDQMANRLAMSVATAIWTDSRATLLLRVPQSVRSKARVGSPTHGEWEGVELSAENHRQLWVPPGFAHGFLVLSETAEVLYKTTDYYAPELERCLAWNDPHVGVAWPIGGREPTLSEKDRSGMAFADLDEHLRSDDARSVAPQRGA